MPLYDFECPHLHRFDRLVAMADRNTPVPCEGLVNQLVTDDSLLAKYADGTEPMPDDLAWQTLDVLDGNTGEQLEEGKILVRKVPCQLQATLIIGAHNNPGGAIFHNAAANRDAAREGRYDPANPSRRFVTKGRGWRK